MDAMDTVEGCESRLSKALRCLCTSGRCAAADLGNVSATELPKSVRKVVKT